MTTPGRGRNALTVLFLQIHAEKPFKMRVHVGINIFLYILLQLYEPMRQQLAAVLLPYFNAGSEQLKHFNPQSIGQGNQGFIAYPCPVPFNAVDHLDGQMSHFGKFFLRNS
jgi:hypothetical protein